MAHKRQQKLKAIRYPGILGKPTRKFQTLAFLLPEPDAPEWHQRWRTENHSSLLLELLRHYKIDRSKPDAFLSLSYRLACDHVPAFTVVSRRGPGRPKSTNTTLRKFLGLAKPGAPKKWTDKNYKRFLTHMRSVANNERFRGHGAVTKTLKFIISEYAKSASKSVVKTLRSDLPYWQKWYSNARKKFPEMAI